MPSFGGMRLFQLGVLSVVTCLSLGAEATEKVGPDIIRVPGQPITYKWADGREAEIRVADYVDNQVDLSFQVTENLCNYRQIGQRCNYHIPFRRLSVAMVWTKHADATKIGQIVKRKQQYGTDFEDLKNEQFLFFHHGKFAPRTAGDIKAEQISCENYAWLPTSQSGEAPLKTNVSRWEAELMINNAEHDLAENRTIGGFNHFDLTRNDQGSLTVGLSKFYTSLVGGLIPPVFDSSSMVFETSQNGKPELCQTTIKADFAKLLMVISGPVTYSNYKTYNENQDETFRISIHSSSGGYRLFLDGFTKTETVTSSDGKTITTTKDLELQ